MKKGSRMFNKVTRTWSPVTGCYHGCCYCWSRRLVEKRLRYISEKYRDGFIPKIHEKEFKKTFKPGEFVFICDMSDLWGSWVSREWILRVIEHVRRFPKTTFLFLTKNPRRYHEFADELRGMDNVILGATIETDRDWMYREYKISRAPLLSERYVAMREIDWARKMISIEPILDFNEYRFTKWIIDIQPEFVYIGYDNYNNRLPEPTMQKTLWLIDELRENGITVYKKTIRKAWYER